MSPRLNRPRVRSSSDELRRGPGYPRTDIRSLMGHWPNGPDPILNPRGPSTERPPQSCILVDIS